MERGRLARKILKNADRMPALQAKKSGYAVTLKEPLINCLCGRIAALRGARNLNIFLYMPRFLRSVRLALHPTQAINHRFLKIKKHYFTLLSLNVDNL